MIFQLIKITVRLYELMTQAMHKFSNSICFLLATPHRFSKNLIIHSINGCYWFF